MIEFLGKDGDGNWFGGSTNRAGDPAIYQKLKSWLELFQVAGLAGLSQNCNDAWTTIPFQMFRLDEN